MRRAKSRSDETKEAPPEPHSEPRVLSIPEIILNICHFVDQSDSVFDVENAMSVLQKRAALLNIARVAKRFTNPALSFLWAEQHGLAALIRTFGPGVIDELADEKLFFLTLPRDDAWSRFQLYAGFVQTLYLTPEYLHMSVLPILVKRGDYLLPNLRRLVVMDWPADQLGSISMFFGPSLHAFRFKRPLPQHLVHMLEEPLRRLATISPTLFTLEMDLEPLEGDERMELGGTLHSFTRLTNVDLPIVGILAYDVLSHLASIPYLRHAYLRLSDDANVDPGRSRVEMSLESLHVQGNWEVTQALFKRFSFGRVRKLAITPPTAGGNLLEPSLFNFLTQACPRTVEFTLDQRDEPQVASLNRQLHPLLSLTHLQVLRVWTGLPVDIQAGQLLRIPRAHSSLRVLNIFRPTSTRPASEVRPHLGLIMTLEELVMFASSCPQLTEITMPLNAMQIPVVPLVPTYSVKTITIAAHYSPIDRPGDVASLLRSAFPNARLILMSYIHGHSTPRDSRLTEWGVVLVLIKVARREEKERARLEAVLAESGKVT